MTEALADSLLTRRPTFSGLASGLDTGALVDSLIAIEREPLNRLEARREQVATQQSLMRDLNTKLLALRDASREIDNRSFSGNSESSVEEFLSYKSDTSDKDVVTARATSGANPSSLDITVQEVATAGRQFSAQYGSTDEVVIAAGTTISIQLNDAEVDPPEPATTVFEYTVGPAGLTLAGLRTLINSSEDNDDLISADIVQVSDDEFRLTLTARGEGAKDDFTISGDALSLDEALKLEGRDARFTLNGLPLTRSTNTITDVLIGITFELQGVSKIENLDDLDDENIDPIYEKTTIDVSVDNDKIVTTLQKFITKFNDVMTFINKQQKVDSETKRNGPLGNDSTLRTLKARLLDQVSRRFDFSEAPNNPFTSPGSIGLEIEAGGKLKIDKDQLKDALEKNTLAVRRFFSGADAVDESGETIEVPKLDDNGDPIAGRFVNKFDDGLATGLSKLLKPIVRIGDGLFATRNLGFQARLDGFDDSIERFIRRLAKRQDTLVAQFTRLEQIVASFNAQSSFLSGLQR